MITEELIKLFIIGFSILVFKKGCRVREDQREDPGVTVMLLSIILAGCYLYFAWKAWP